ncbi:unnamed protein product [Pleuronectes platessa]|uniref:Uncharacterized protein n=1 Tax=Pleuronectes platessa TaxID=8262 RepID=A0A9N7VL50_PLEPL|nr:unnamed protein product [Pleuronectes platessa]
MTNVLAALGLHLQQPELVPADHCSNSASHQRSSAASPAASLSIWTGCSVHSSDKLQPEEQLLSSSNQTVSRFQCVHWCSFLHYHILHLNEGQQPPPDSNYKLQSPGEQQHE